MSSSEFKDYYAILGIKKTASADEIKKKFRQLALKYHPDRNQGNKAAEARFKQIGEAYDVLSDEDKRAQYDNFGQFWQQSTSTSRRTNNGTSSNNTNNNTNKVDFNSTDFSQYGNFEEFIDELLGRFSTPNTSTNTSKQYSSQTSFKNPSYRDSSRARKTISTDGRASINLTYAEAFRGTSKRLNIGTETVEVRIPAGAKPGSRIRIAGKGQLNSYSQQREDLYLSVVFEPHSFFSFEDDNLICEVPIAPDEAVLGASIGIPTPDGKVKMKVPAGINSGQVLRLRERGWISARGNRTDLLVRIVIAIPQKISFQEQECYKKIRDLRHENPRDGLEGISL